MSDIKRWDIDTSGEEFEREDGRFVLHLDHAAEIARLREELEHEKKQRAFNDRHLTRMDCGAFRIGIPYEESTCDPAKPCIRCARAKELARLRAAIHEAHKERDDYIDQAYGSGTAEKPCPCEHCARHREETKQ